MTTTMTNKAAIADQLRLYKAKFAIAEEALEEARREVTSLQTEMARLTEVWLASPEAAKRLDGYRELGAKCAELEGERDAVTAILASARPTPSRTQRT